jgi:DNA topoisomerase-1
MLDGQPKFISSSRTQPVVAARVAGLRYVTGRMPGIRRVGKGKSFRYLGPDGRPVRDQATLARVRSLVIPPAWTEVWICPIENGHLQAVGRDSRRRKQYRYHSRWREVRDETKFQRMADFGKILPMIRARVKRDLARKGLPKEKVLATIVRLLETTLIRVGNEEYTKQNNSYGLTTLRDHHVEVTRTKVHFYFRGKSGIRHAISVTDPYLSKIVRRLRDLPGYELFQYVDEDGATRSIGSSDVNDYLREITGRDFTAKDFRTWSGTVLAIEALYECEPFTTQRQAKKNILTVTKNVAERLGNTVAVCRKCYIHPGVFESYVQRALTRPPGTNSPARREREFVKMLKKWSAPKTKLTLKQALVKSVKAASRSKMKPADAKSGNRVHI